MWKTIRGKPVKVSKDGNISFYDPKQNKKVNIHYSKADIVTLPNGATSVTTQHPAFGHNLHRIIRTRR